MRDSHATDPDDDEEDEDRHPMDYIWLISPMKTQYIKPAAVKKLIKEVAGKRTAKEFLLALDSYVERAIRRAAAEHNGGKRTVDASVAGHTLGNR